MNKLEQITYATMKRFKKHNIVLPGDYSEVFVENALTSGYDIQNQDLLKDDIKQELHKLDKLFEQTNQSLNTLSDSTIHAVEAIRNHDDNELNKIKEEIIALQSKVKILQNELYTDSLTKAYNRKWFNENFVKEDRFTQNGFLVFLDLNNFKFINDNYGHIVGDMVLKYLVVYLNKNLKSLKHQVIRYAGDEFLIMFEEENIYNKIEIELNEIQKTLWKQKLTVKNNEKMTFSFSFSYGLAHFKKKEFVEDVLNDVDDKMYKNKHEVKKFFLK